MNTKKTMRNEGLLCEFEATLAELYSKTKGDIPIEVRLGTLRAMAALARDGLKAGKHPDGWEWAHERDARLLNQDGRMCEAHPGLPFMHDETCAGPGMPWMVMGKAAILALLATAVAAARAEAIEECAKIVDSCIRYMPTMDGSERLRNPSAARDLREAAAMIRAIPPASPAAAKLTPGGGE